MLIMKILRRNMENIYSVVLEKKNTPKVICI